MNMSVAMATYNGAQYIEEQIMTIMSDLDTKDEIVISDDGSNDGTISIIKRFQEKYDNIILVQGPCNGHVENFENALKNCKNEIVCLSDQDDIWMSGKRNKIIKCFNDNDYYVVMHTASSIDSNGKKTDTRIDDFHHGYMRNILKSCYWGCCMAFRKEFLNMTLPFPEGLVAHDQFLGAIAEKYHKTFFLQEDLIMHRIHESNVTKKLSFKKKILFRINLYLQIKNTIRSRLFCEKK